MQRQIICRGASPNTRAAPTAIGAVAALRFDALRPRIGVPRHVNILCESLSQKHARGYRRRLLRMRADLLLAQRAATETITGLVRLFALYSRKASMMRVGGHGFECQNRRRRRIDPVAAHTFAGKIFSIVPRSAAQAGNIGARLTRRITRLQLKRFLIFSWQSRGPSEQCMWVASIRQA